MHPGQLIFSLLSAAAPVVALVGYEEAGTPKYGIYPLRIPQGKPRPAIAYQAVSSAADDLDRCGLPVTTRVQVSVYADTYETACALSAAVRAALHGYEADGVTIDRENGPIDHHDDAANCYFQSTDFTVVAPAD